MVGTGNNETSRLVEINLIKSIQKTMKEQCPEEEADPKAKL